MAHKTIFRSHMIKAAEGNKVLLSTCFFTSGRIIKRFEKWTPISLLRAAYYMGEGVETPLSADDCPLYHNGGRV